MNLNIHTLSALNEKYVFGVCQSLVKDNLPLAYTVLYPIFSI